METHDPVQLYAAAQDRMAAARLLQTYAPGDVAAVYVAGLAVEMILQALSHLDGSVHDARHRLDLWLGKCSPTLQHTMRSLEAWSTIDATWSNRLRYYSKTQWLGMLRKRSEWRVIKGDDEARIRYMTSSFVESAEIVVKKGLAEWRRKHN